ncbi:MAG: O-methyltransferase [candidate division Zixibacteria bacterium]|nr:O-methyltransferase [candidate division Zixibacteria bacterium]
MTDSFSITNPAIHAYLDRVRPPSDEILREMEEHAEARKFPYLGPQCARILHALVKMSGARSIFELGSGFGYTMYWMAKALPARGMVVGTEGDPTNVAAAKEYFRRGGLSNRTDLRCGDALGYLRAEPGPFDMIYCDIDKEGYPDALDLAKPRLRPGGIFVADNLLRSGQVLNDVSRETATVAIQEFTRRLYADPDFFTVIIPIRDGMSISVKAG